MPYCCRCGTQVADADAFCPKCGAQQRTGAAPSPASRANGSGPSRRTASILCYIPWLGWIAAIIVLASERFRTDREVRFHAFQGLYLFVAWLLVDWVISPAFAMMPGPSFAVHRVLQLALLAIWIFMIVKASQEQRYSLPIVGDLAEKSL